MQNHRNPHAKVPNDLQNSNFETATALENLRAEVVQIEALVRATEAAADGLPAPTHRCDSQTRTSPRSPLRWRFGARRPCADLFVIAQACRPAIAVRFRSSRGMYLCVAARATRRTSSHSPAATAPTPRSATSRSHRALSSPSPLLKSNPYKTSQAAGARAADCEWASRSTW